VYGRILESKNCQHEFNVEQDTEFVGYTTALGAFEVYFMGVRVFSKIQSGLWPSIPLLAEKCKQVWNDF
jgi:hypothetical protein